MVIRGPYVPKVYIDNLKSKLFEVPDEVISKAPLPLTDREARDIRLKMAMGVGAAHELIIDLWQALQKHGHGHFHGSPEFQALRRRVYEMPEEPSDDQT